MSIDHPIVHAVVDLARSRGALQPYLTASLGNVDVITAPREELPDNQIHSAGPSWIATGTVPDVAASLPLPYPTPG